MMRAKKLQAALFGMVMLGAVAACGDDNGGSGNGGDNGGDNGDAAIGTGDVDASHVIFDGEELDLEYVTCSVVAVEDDSLRVIAEGTDSAGHNYGITVNEQPDGGSLRITRGQGDPEFDGYEWSTPSPDTDQVEMGFNGARAAMELRWNQYSGHDETEDGGPVDIDFDLVCS